MKLPPHRAIGLLLGPLAAALLLLLDTPIAHHPTFGAHPARAAAVAAWMALWWVTEAVPIAWTATLPLVLFALLDVLPGGAGANVRGAAAPYFDPYIFLFAGGMGIAAAMQQWHLHRRIALRVMLAVGTEPKRLLFGLLAATAFISLWISNTATAAMMLPIGLALVAQLEAHTEGLRLQHYGMALMLAIAYGANVGGIGTKIGTAPNAQFAGFMGRLGVEISFLQFALVGLPFVALFLPVVWWALWRIGRNDGLRGDLGREVIAGELAKLGPIRRAERVVLGVFLAAAALWVAGKELVEVLQRTWPKLTSAQFEGGVAMAAALLLMLLRSEGRAVLGFAALRQVPWSTLVLLGGGFAMAGGVQGSGLSQEMAATLGLMQSLPPFSQVLLAGVSAVAISAVCSNTATIAILLVVLRDAVAPGALNSALFAATLACSCDFALPAGTPPNAIVFGSGYVSLPKMARTGVMLDLAAALLVAAWCWVSVDWVLR